MKTANAVRSLRFSWSGLFTSLAVVLFIALVVRFLSMGIPCVARHPADKHWAYWLHIAGGSVVMALGPFQFIAPIRDRFRRYHRWAGYAFVGASTTAFVGFWAVQPGDTDVFFIRQATAISLGMLAMTAAVIAARRKRLLTHQHNMTRAFALAA